MSDKHLMIHLKKYFAECEEEMLQFEMKAKTQSTKRHFSYAADVYANLVKGISKQGKSLVT